MKRLWIHRLGFLPLGFLLMLGALSPLAAVASDLKLRLELAWGTDGSAPEGKNLKELDA